MSRPVTWSTCRRPRPGLRQFLNALAIGILVFLIWDVLAHAYEPLDTALGRLHNRTGGWDRPLVTARSSFSASASGF